MMANEIRVNIKRVVRSLAIVLIPFLFTLLIPTQGHYGQNWTTFTVWIVFHFLGLPIGGCMLILRLIRLLKNNQESYYQFFGVTNAVCGLFGLTNSILNHISVPSWYVFDLIVGFAILIDYFFIQPLKKCV